MKCHIMRKESYACVMTELGNIPLYKSLCGLREPPSRAIGKIRPTCKTCIGLSQDHEGD